MLHRERHSETGTLALSGRDIKDESKYAVRFHDGQWSCQGKAEEVYIKDKKDYILDALKEGGSMSAKSLSSATGIKYSTLRGILPRMIGTGQITKDLNGNYILPNTLIGIEGAAGG